MTPSPTEARWPDRRFADLLRSRHPIVLAPMAGAGGVALAAGAIEGGAVGSLPCGMLAADDVREQVLQVRTRADGPINLNFFCHLMPAATDDGPWRALLAPFHERFGVAAGPEAGPLRCPFGPDLCEAVEAARPELVSFHFGLPEQALLDRVRSSGAKVLATAATVAEARWLAERGVDAIVAQGWEAGGHSGRFLGGRPDEQMGLFALLPQIADAVDLPVIAAGGIADGRGIAAALILGAAAVQIGTAYLHCPESLILESHRSALRSEAGEHSVFTNLFSGGLARGLWTPPMEALGPERAEAPPYPLATAALMPLAAEAAKRGEAGFRPMWAGQSARIGGRPRSARELTEGLARDALARIAGKD